LDKGAGGVHFSPSDTTQQPLLERHERDATTSIPWNARP